MQVPMVQTPPLRHRRLWRRAALVFVALVGGYLLVAYAVMPGLWMTYLDRHPAIAETPGITLTSDKHPGDPINVALIGSADDLQHIMKVAGWHPADALGLRSDLRIATDTVLNRPYDDAPVSNLYLFGRKEDFAFEQPVGNNPRQRHHVRFWKSAKVDKLNRPLWAGAVTFDERVGLSHTTGQVTHHISGDVDAERDRLFRGLQATRELQSVQYLDDFHPVREGTNGGGDRWHTDGRLQLGTIRSNFSE